MSESSTKRSRHSGAARRTSSRRDPRPAESKHLSRPFAPAHLARAKEIVSRYRLVIERDPELGFLGRSVEMPLVMADGPTVDQCVKATTEAMVGAVATMLESGQRPPSPASEGRREVQLNVRLTAEEKLSLEAAAQRDGFRSVSDYVRAAALAKAG